MESHSLWKDPIEKIKQLTSAKVIGYPVTNEGVNFPIIRGNLYEADGAIVDIDNQNRIVYTIDTLGGMSGGPLCSILNGKHTALGIHVGGASVNKKAVNNKAVSINSDLIRDLTQLNE